MKIIHKTRLLAINGEQLLVIEKVVKEKKLTFPGGVKKKKESFEESLERETEEEIGLKISKHKLLHVQSYAVHRDLNIVMKHHFVLHTKTNEFRVLEPTKFKDAYWIHWKEALPLLDNEDRKATKTYFKKNIK
ncbi:NUDIX domain-containing protein [Kordia sp. YSTF-M3]|uniref:NUDIX domain-containing protein n=1 Tax=Kordia aestuariivivens TaxID=2759037 RepID=A0ABR7QF22_9FLAO|nr:NUDIX domain-containing protein [Kordia aestuariivivens]MBC8757172.1 NUDIX domain-containing protein [Kordia aestuariivivens]